MIHVYPSSRTHIRREIAQVHGGSDRDADDQSEEDLQLKSELEMLVERLKVRLPFHEYMR